MTISSVSTVPASIVSTSIVSFSTDVVSPSSLFSSFVVIIPVSNTSEFDEVPALSLTLMLSSVSLIMEFICLNISQPIMTQMVIIKASFR